ncbi:vasorin isoform X3 [Neocloeon triangulifer]|uniref:vasorin isoform X3 n=1 Tax=Neocloeon triangulifer TaxID=2078957 RepID=UPI00286EF89F|nr:vasorin isoform X3 [Neocloeon triangulifer]
MTTLRWLCACLALMACVQAQLCPWQNDHPELASACLCATNLAREVSIQCDLVDWPLLLAALQRHLPPGPGPVIDLLYVSNSTVRTLPADVLVGVRRVRSLQMSGCKIEKIETGAFRGQETSLKNLNLQDNLLDAVPVAALRPLRNLTLLDLSRNKLNRVTQDSFSSLGALATLKLADNEITLEPGAFHGLEASLRNLNLKGTRQKRLPEAVRGLRALAFLDLAQNGLRELPTSGAAAGRTLQGLDSLTAINLERNLIQSVAPDAFAGVADTLSSLSLLNNLLTDFPTPAISTLKELRVLDIGFNLITTLPTDAFNGTPSLTLLALDGNPLASVAESSLIRLNSTLRGLSIGGRFLKCDCKLKWLANWLKNGELQVTSRERAPQFCGEPPRLRDRGFSTIQPEELSCEATNEVEDASSAIIENAIPVQAVETSSSTTTSTTTEAPTSPSTTSSSTTTTTTTTPAPTTPRSTTTTSTTTTTTRPTTTTTQRVRITGSANVLVSKPPPVVVPSAAPPPPRVVNSPKPTPARQNPALILGGSHRSRIEDDEDEVIVKSASRVDNYVVINWDSKATNILGFRVVYRLFGDRSFKQGPPLDASEREFKIKNVPPQECLVVCVVSLEEVRASPDTVPPRQCREIRTEQKYAGASTGNMDRVTVAASAAVCGVVLLAVLVLLVVSRRRAQKLRRALSRQQQVVPPSIPHGLCPHKAANLLMAGSVMGCEAGVHGASVSRSIADGQSQRSFSGLSAAKFLSSGGAMSRPDLRQSRQSLAAPSERMSRVGSPQRRPPSAQQGSRTRSRSRESLSYMEQTMEGSRPASRCSSALHRHHHTHLRAGTNTSGYDTSDNWTDHDMDIYMARNPTRGSRNSLVRL